MRRAPKVSWESHAFLLHTKPLREGKVLAFLFSEKSGVVTAVTRCATQRRQGRRALSPFQLYWWTAQKGHSDLLRTVLMERDGAACWLTGERLMCGMYLNELILKLCQPWDAHPEVFAAYGVVMQNLATPEAPLQAVLRHFDLQLLHALGYGLPFDQVLASDHAYYQYHFDLGFVPAQLASQQRFSRVHLMAMAAQNWTVPGVLPAAKKLCRLALQGALGDQKIKSRALFEQPAFSRKPVKKDAPLDTTL